MTSNTNPETGIPFGYIRADYLDSDVMNDLQMNGTDVYYEDALKDAKGEVVREWVAKIVATGVLELIEVTFDEDDLTQMVEKHVEAEWDGSDWETRFHDSYNPDEPIHEGEKDGVKYRTSWLGGALNVWIFESPFTTDCAREASLCVPHACNLDQDGEGSYPGYTVPDAWLTEEYIAERDRKKQENK